MLSRSKLIEIAKCVGNSLGFRLTLGAYSAVRVFDFWTNSFQRLNLCPFLLFPCCRFYGLTKLNKAIDTVPFRSIAASGTLIMEASTGIQI